MAEKSWPFESGPGSIITEDQWSRMASNWQDSGVVAEGPSSTALKVSSQSVPLTLTVKAGFATIAGMHYELDADTTVSFAANTTASSRWDRVVLRLDRAANEIRLVVKQGTGFIPSVDRSWATPEICIANFLVRANSTNVIPADVRDSREFVGRRVRPVAIDAPTDTILDGDIYHTAGTAFVKLAGNPLKLLTMGDGSIHVCTSTTRPTGVNNLLIYEFDTGNSYVYVGGWKQINYGTGPLAVLYRFAGATPVAANTSSLYVPWDTAFEDTHQGWVAGDPTKYTVKRDGMYEVTVSAWGTTSATSGYMSSLVRVNNSANKVFNVAMSPVYGGKISIQTTSYIRLFKDEWVRLELQSFINSQVDIQPNSMISVRHIKD